MTGDELFWGCVKHAKWTGESSAFVADVMGIYTGVRVMQVRRRNKKLLVQVEFDDVDAVKNVFPDAVPINLATWKNRSVFLSIPIS